MIEWGDVQWIAHHDVNLTLNFSVGHAKCKVDLTIHKGARIQEICYRLFNEEHIPEYLHNSITNLVLQSVYEFQLYPTKWSQDISDVALMIEQARLLARQFEVTTTISNEFNNNLFGNASQVSTTQISPTKSNWPQNESSGQSTQQTSRPTSRNRLSSADILDPQKLIASSFARGGRTSQQSLQLAKMYHYLVSGDHSVTHPVTHADELILEHVAHLNEKTRKYFRKKKQPSGTELLFLNDTTNEFRDMIAQLERSLASSMAQLIQAKDLAIATLRENQSREMDRVSQGGQVDRIPLLVEKHMEEMEGLEAKWTVELAEMTKRQRHEYLAFVCDLYKNRERYLEDKRAMGPQQVAKLRQEHAIQQMEQSNQYLKRYFNGGWTSLIFGKQNQNYYSYSSSSSSSNNSNNPNSSSNASSDPNNSNKVLRISSNNKSLLMSREIISGDNDTYSIVVMLGSQLKVPFEVQVYAGGGILSSGIIGDVSNTTPTSPSHLHLTESENSAHSIYNNQSPSNSIYGNSLNAIVMISDPSLQCSSPSYNEFFKLTSKSTELHFESARTQIDHIRSQVLTVSQASDTSLQNPFSSSMPIQSPSNTGASTSLNSKLNPGDFFVTTHSNLGNTQVVFHMVGERVNLANSWASLVAGLNNILTVASHYDIASLSLPVFPLEPEFRHLFMDGQGAKRIEEIVRTVRSYLVQNSASGTSLKLIRFVCPHGGTDSEEANDAAYFDKIKSTVANLFNQALAS